MAKDWFDYPRIDNFGQIDPAGPYYKPDSNIQLPGNYPITALLPGTVTSLQVTSWGQHVVTIKLDTPLNSLATHTFYEHMSNFANGLAVGQHVTAGQLIGYNNPSGQVPLGFGLYSGDVYGSGQAWTILQQDLAPGGAGLLNPVKLLDNAAQGKGVSTSTITLRAFIDQAINDLKNKVNGGTGTFQVASQNIDNFMIGWSHVEGGGVTNACKFNILNTMQDESGASQCPGTLPGIKSYPDDGTGIKALVDALTNGLYPNIVHAITTNDENNLGFHQHPMANNIAQELSMWVHGKRTPLAEDYILSIMESAGIGGAYITGGTMNGGNAASQDQIDQWGNTSLGPDTSGVTTGGAAQNAVNDLSAINNFFQQLSGFFSNPVRLIKIMLGSVLLIAGIALLVKQFVPQSVQNVAKAAIAA